MPVKRCVNFMEQPASMPATPLYLCNKIIKLNASRSAPSIERHNSMHDALHRRQGSGLKEVTP